LEGRKVCSVVTHINTSWAAGLGLTETVLCSLLG
jgi:hypothetical protein